MLKEKVMNKIGKTPDIFKLVKIVVKKLLS